MQDKLAANRRERSLAVGAEAPSLLAGLIADAGGNRMTPTHATKRAKRYRYYVSALLADDVALRGTHVKAGSKTAISGIAWDGGYGIRSVEISADNGKTWAEASLGKDLGKFAFRPWSYDFAPKVRGKLSLTARATNKVGQTQTKELIQNPAGYHHNLIQTLTLDVA